MFKKYHLKLKKISKNYVFNTMLLTLVMHYVSIEACVYDAITETCSSNGNFKYCQNVSPELRGARVTLELL